MVVRRMIVLGVVVSRVVVTFVVVVMRLLGMRSVVVCVLIVRGVTVAATAQRERDGQSQSGCKYLFHSNLYV